MTDTETNKQASVQTVVETVKALVLAINEKGRKESIQPGLIGASQAIRHRLGSSLRQTVCNQTEW